MSLCVEPGEVLGLLGPNGAGKTTTINCMIAEEGPTAGTVSETFNFTFESCVFLLIVNGLNIQVDLT